MNVQAPRRLARFELLRVLGRGAQATVWLAHDPRLDREVALKLMDRPADAHAIGLWLHEARAVSRLTHPHVVPVFEADEFEGQPYLVFEYVEGPTLTQARKGRPAMPAREAVTLMIGVLDALAAAHDLGVIHRDLKPSNILLGRDGRARVMDFGIAARRVRADGPATAEDPMAGLVIGSPGYISPEAARGESPVAAMDVFAAGVVLAELLAGAPLLQESDPYRAIERVQHEDLGLPPSAVVDPVLRGIVHRALARRTTERYDSAQAFHAALSTWLKPSEPDAASTPGSPATLEFLLRRMRHKSDFPALSSSIVRIQRLAASDTESLTGLADEIRKDVALTNKLLRMVNTAHFTSAAGEGVSTVSRAVALVGFGGIRNMALSVLLLEHMTDKAHASVLKEEFLRALMAGSLAEELMPVARGAEEAFLAAMFQNLGRLLTEFYLPEEAVLIRQQLADRKQTVTRAVAARRVLGLTQEELGSGVAEAWGLPDALRRGLRAPEGDVPLTAERDVERMRWLGRGANAMADALLAGDGDEQAARLLTTATQYAPVLGLTAREIVSATYVTRGRLKDLAAAMSLSVAAGAPARRLLEATTAGADAQTLQLQPPRPTGSGDRQGPSADPLRAAYAAFDNPGAPLTTALRLALDAIHRTLGFRSVVLCLREPAGNRLSGRFNVGADADVLCNAFKIRPNVAATGDLFAWLSAKGMDLLVSDARTVAARLPPWYRQRVNAPTFLLLPLMQNGVPLGLIYADKAQSGSIVLPEPALASLRALRDRMAISVGREQPL